MDFDITHQGAKERSVEIAFFCQEKIKFNSARFREKKKRKVKSVTDRIKHCHQF